MIIKKLIHEWIINKFNYFVKNNPECVFSSEDFEKTSEGEEFQLFLTIPYSLWPKELEKENYLSLYLYFLPCHDKTPFPKVLYRISTMDINGTKENAQGL